MADSSSLFGDNAIDWKKKFLESKFGKDDADWIKFFDDRFGPRIVVSHEEPKKDNGMETKPNSRT